MKTPEECVELFWDTFRAVPDVELFRRIQTEAWNEAIELAAEKATLCYEDGKDKELGYVHAKTRLIVINKESILKLKK